jgi:hypothetical protein
MLCHGLWNGDTSFLFDAGRQPPTSTRCSPATSSCTSSWYIITSKLYLEPHRVTVQRMGVLPTFHESSPSSKFLQEKQSKIWWTNTCSWHVHKTTLRLHRLTILGACRLQSHSAIYIRSQTTGRRLSDDTATTWSRGPADM